MQDFHAHDGQCHEHCGCSCPEHGGEAEIQLDSQGLEYCELDVLAGDPSVEPPTTLGAGNLPAALSQTFLLHSNPGASKKIYLDFDGHVTSGTSWNSAFTGGASIVTPAYDFNGNTSSFSNSELERIQFIWQRVAEDYAPFDVDVTTQDPGSAALTKSGTGDTEWGIRVVIGGSSTAWYGSAGGVAYVGSFNWSSDTPTFVFEEQLGNGAEKYTAEAISHEVGHTLGLSHDGRTSPSEGYYQGHGSGATGWAPIMGVGYYKELTQWSKGEYAYANNKQDDLTIITTQNGFGYRTDDHGNTLSTATPAAVAGTTLTAWGMIERSSDVDVFSFTTDAGAISLAATPFERSPNLDILMELFNASSSLVASSNPGSLLSGSLTNLVVTAGMYYVRISGVGYGDPLTTGYTDYGSLGQYLVTGNVIAVDYDTVSLVATSAVKNEGNSGFTTLTFTVTRSGNTSAGTTVSYEFLQGTTDAADFGGTLPGGGVLTFAPGETTKILNITVSGDTKIESDESFSIRLTGAGGSTQIGNATAEGTLVNDDIPAFVVSPTSGLVTSENRTTASFTVVLTAAPSADVVVPVSSSDTQEGLPNVSSLTFRTDNWSIPQTVVVTGQDDTIRDGNVYYTIRLAPATSADAAFNGLDAPDVSLVNQDNDKKTGKPPRGGSRGKPADIMAVSSAPIAAKVANLQTGLSVVVPMNLDAAITDQALELWSVTDLINPVRARSAFRK